MNRFIGLNDVKEAPVNPYAGLTDLDAVKARILTAINALVDVDTEDMARVRQLLKSQLYQCTLAIEARTVAVRYDRLYSSGAIPETIAMCANDATLVYETDVTNMWRDAQALNARGFTVYQILYHTQAIVTLTCSIGISHYWLAPARASLMQFKDRLHEEGFHIYDGIPF